MEPIVIIGTGLAGYSLARELRKLSDDKIVLISWDDGAFYSKPMLSNAITKNKTPQELVSFSAETMAKQNDLQILTNTIVEKINTEEQKLVIQQGTTISYSKLVLAVGAKPLKAFKDDNEYIFSVNNLTDYTAFRDAIRDKKNIAIIGAGLIGCEFANDLIECGYEVDVIAPGDLPLHSLLPSLTAQKLNAALQGKGVRWHLQNKVESIQADKSSISLTLSNGVILQPDIVLSAIGLQPDISLAKNAGLKTDKGIVVDNFCCTSDANIYSLGDCAEMEGKVRPFVMPIMTAAKALAKTLTGQAAKVNYPLMPVILKTPACPIVVCLPEQTITGQWQFEEDNEGLTARYVGKNNRLLGFCLSGSHVEKKQDLVKEIKS